ncbi:hypothetical protein GCM10009098_31220 [Rheinheimera aquimaris]|uniref:DarT domain-containing protein n=1 Tax=Rheinheimera aquimaris TaxID=412437 RepID=A0ABN1E7P7_9GAMM|nr:DarT ssDNA thymidine ADP-ribosyltransferase family protein [Rheinheimera aquimaris]MCB5215165.1 DUF4433 domain-containing protein [Rheinheimera aquimaris]
MTVVELSNSKGIYEILHFSTNNGLVGILAKGLLQSRALLPKDEYLENVLHVNAKYRPEESLSFDKSEDWLNFVNLSVSEINRRFFEFSESWHKQTEIWWAILSFDTEILGHQGVYFTTTNNTYEYCRRAKGTVGFEAMFDEVVERKQNYSGVWKVNRATRLPNLTTCEQAEVLYPSALPVTYLRKVYVKERNHHDAVLGWLRQFDLRRVVVEINPDKFIGKKN